jgi:hypothetical protein
MRPGRPTGLAVVLLTLVAGVAGCSSASHPAAQTSSASPVPTPRASRAPSAADGVNPSQAEAVAAALETLRRFDALVSRVERAGTGRVLDFQRLADGQELILDEQLLHDLAHDGFRLKASVPDRDTVRSTAYGEPAGTPTVTVLSCLKTRGTWTYPDGRQFSNRIDRLFTSTIEERDGHWYLKDQEPEAQGSC